MAYLRYSYPVIIFAAAVISAGLAIYAFRRREKSGAATFGWMMLTVAEWLVTSGFVTLSRTPDGAMFWVRARYMGLVFMVPLFLIYALRYAGFEKWLSPRRSALLFVIPVITSSVTWTDDFHHLMIQSIRFVPDGPLLGLDSVTYGAWFWVHTVYSYLLVLLSVGLLIRMAVRSLRLYRRQSIALIVGVIPPLAASVIDAFLLIPELKHPIAPIGFAVMGMAFAVSMFQYHLISVVPVARDKVVESMSDGMVVVDAQGLIVDMNPAAEEALGIDAHEAVGRPAGQAFSPWRALVEQYHEEQAAQAEIDLMVDGEMRHFDLRISPLTSRRGRLSGRLAIWRDITERKRAEAEREQLIHELDAFSHTVAHDLKNPLSQIAGFADLLELTLDQQGAVGEEQRVHVEFIKQSAGKMIGIIDELLKLAQVRKLGDIDMSRLNMGPIVDEARQRLSRPIRERRAEISLPDEWPAARGYAPWIEEVWVNYLSNAIKYGGDPPHLALGADPAENGMIRFWVRDNGPGLTDEEQARLFTPFTRLGQAQAEGHGLGLSIVRQIVEKHSGEVGVISAPGEGSAFWFTLPGAPPEKPQDAD
jgi:PAS domain S-box-containing protein